MKIPKRIFLSLLMVALVAFAGLSVTLAQTQEETEQALVQIVAASDTFTDWLEQHPNWVGHAYLPEDGNVWYVEFYNESEDEWLGYANIDAESGEIQDSFAPVPLPQNVYQEQQPRIRTLVLNDPEVETLLTDASLWDVYTDYNRYESSWEVYLYRGTEAILVRASLDENDYFSIREILDPNELDEEQTTQAARDSAISLAYSAPGIDQALDGHDSWRTYIENQGGTRWSVSFAADEVELFYALVDVATNKVLESAVGTS